MSELCCCCCCCWWWCACNDGEGASCALERHDDGECHCPLSPPTWLFLVGFEGHGSPPGQSPTAMSDGQPTPADSVENPLNIT